MRRDLEYIQSYLDKLGVGHLALYTDVLDTQSIQQAISKIKEKYSGSPEKLFDYVVNSINNSEYGERVENNVVERFSSKPYFDQLLYQGGNGNFVDMIFSVDLIVKFKNGDVYTIQVKSNEDQVKTFIADTKKNKAVDLVVWPGNGGTFNVKKVKDPEKTITI